MAATVRCQKGVTVGGDHLYGGELQTGQLWDLIVLHITTVHFY